MLKEHAALAGKPENILRFKLTSITGTSLYNLSKFTFDGLPKDRGFNGLLDDTNQLAPNLNNHINGFSPNVRAIVERFDFGAQITCGC